MKCGAGQWVGGGAATSPLLDPEPRARIGGTLSNASDAFATRVTGRLDIIFLVHVKLLTLRLLLEE